MPPAIELLTVDGVEHSFGGVRAVNGCSLSLPAGVVAALIGPNGAGKSTLVSVVAGALPLQKGRVSFDGAQVGGWPSWRIARRGLIRTFQISREFGRLTVLENMMVPARPQAGESLWAALRRPPAVLADERRHLQRALALLEAFQLYRLRDEYARNLSGGQKRLLELARALMADPKLLLLDEPMAGVNPALADQLGERIAALPQHGITVLMVEHNLGIVEQLCERVIVMAEGRTLAAGTMAELRANPEVVQAYLGGSIAGRAVG